MNEKLKQLFQDVPKRAVQIDDKLFVFIGADTAGLVEKKIKHALSHGKTVVENGVSRWVELWPVTNEGKSGSERYIWKDGDTVRVQRFLVTTDPKRGYVNKSLGFAWAPAKDVL